MIESAIDFLTRISLRFKWVVIALSILTLIAGVFAITQLNQELLPKIEFPQTIVMVMYPSASAAEVRDEVTIPIEVVVADIDGVVNIETTSYSGISVVVIKSDFGQDLETLREDVQAAIDELDLPEGVEPPELLSFSFADIPLAAMGVSSPGMSLEELKALVETDIVPALEGVPDVARVEVSGGQELPTEPPPTSEPTEEPEPTSEPTIAPSPTPTEEPEISDLPACIAGIPLPDTWQQAGTAQNIKLETTNDLTPEIIGGILNFAPQNAGRSYARDAPGNAAGCTRRAAYGLPGNS